MKAFSRVLVAMVAALAALFVSTGTSHAGLDNELSLVDGQDRTMTIQQWDTFLNGVFPLDRNRLTREWFHSGSAVYNVAGSGADAFEGTLELGYQIGFPWSLGVGINFSHGISVSSGFYRATAHDREGVWAALVGQAGKVPQAGEDYECLSSRNGVSDPHLVHKLRLEGVTNELGRGIQPCFFEDTRALSTDRLHT